MGTFEHFWALLALWALLDSLSTMGIFRHSGRFWPFWKLLGLIGHYGYSGQFRALWALWALLGSLGIMGTFGPLEPSGSESEHFWAL